MRLHNRRRDILRGVNRRIIAFAVVCSILFIILYSYAGSRLPTLNEPNIQPKNNENNVVNTYDVKQPGSETNTPKIKILFWEEGAVHWLGNHMLVSINMHIFVTRIDNKLNKIKYFSDPT